MSTLRLGERLLLYFIGGGTEMGMEQKTLEEIHSQGRTFYAVTFCLFFDFTLPGLIYRQDLQHYICRDRKRRH
jgi:hypothetical protein